MDINNNAGLINFGNTCFMNASLQLMISASVMICYLCGIEEFKQTDNMKYIQTFIDYLSPTTNILGPRILHAKYMQMNTRYHGYTQEDSHEFLTYTLDDIIENVKKLNNTQYTHDIEKYITVEINQHVHYKKGQDADSVKKIKENMLSFPINKDCKSLQDCYELFHVEDNDEFTLTFNIFKVPKYLFISIKRFLNNGHTIEKLNTDISIPMETNMFNSNHNYKLKGFVIHSGGYMGGHYYSYCVRKINKENKWFCYNDQRVTEVSDDIINAEISKGYIYLYSHM